MRLHWKFEDNEKNEDEEDISLQFRLRAWLESLKQNINRLDVECRGGGVFNRHRTETDQTVFDVDESSPEHEEPR